MRSDVYASVSVSVSVVCGHVIFFSDAVYLPFTCRLLAVYLPFTCRLLYFFYLLHYRWSTYMSSQPAGTAQDPAEIRENRMKAILREPTGSVQDVISTLNTK